VTRMSLAPRCCFITGCDRGYGLELVKQMLSLNTPPLHLFATYRSLSEELKVLSDKNSNLYPLEMDITDVSSYPSIVKKIEDIVGDDGLNVVINNAGISTHYDLETVTPQAMTTAFEVNCIAPLFLSRALLPLLDKAALKPLSGQPSLLDKSALKPLSCQPSRSAQRAAIVQISGDVASVSQNRTGSNYAYRCSKTALNQSMRSMSVDLNDRGILVTAMSPCPEPTDDIYPDISVENIVSDMIETITKLEDIDHGAFIRYTGSPIPW